MSVNKYLHIISCLVLLSCGNNQGKEGQSDINETALSENEMASIQKQREDSIHIVVMGIHDEVMPKMQDIFNMKTSLRDKISNSEGKNDSLGLIIEKLEMAEEEMMNWMRSFKPGNISSHDSLMQYYLSEKKKIETVREAMELVLEQADSVKD